MKPFSVKPFAVALLLLATTLLSACAGMSPSAGATKARPTPPDCRTRSVACDTGAETANCRPCGSCVASQSRSRWEAERVASRLRHHGEIVEVRPC